MRQQQQWRKMRIFSLFIYYHRGDDGRESDCCRQSRKKTLLRRDRKIAAAKERETYVGEEKKGTFGKM